MGEDRETKIKQLRHYMNVIEKQSGATVRPWREDGYINVLNKYGTEKDTTEHYRYEPDPDVPDSELLQFYESNGLFAKIIDAPAEESVKHGFELKGSDEEVEDLYKEALNKLEWEELAITALKYTRLFGGAIAVMLINDGGGLEDPVNWQRIESIDDIRVYDRSIVVPDFNTIYTSDMYGDPFSAMGSKLGYPEYYDVYSIYGSFRVHESRCLIFQNGVLSERSSNMIYRMWGVPEYMRIHRAVRDAEVAHGSSVKLLDRAVQAVYSMKGLTTELAMEGGEDRILQRLQLIDMARGLMNTVTVDADGEDYSFRQFSFTGVSEVIDTTCNYLSALTNIPQTILFGRSPAGMNSTGESDMENWYSYVERIQKRILKNNLRYLLAVIFQAALNKGELEDPPILDVEFKPLWSLSEQEQMAVDQQKASIAQTRAGTAQMYIDMQVLDPSEVRKSLAKDEEFDIETMLDDYTEEELEENAPSGEDDMMGGMMGGMPGGPGGGGAPGGMPGGAPGGPGGMPGGDQMAAMMQQQPQMPPQGAENGPNSEDKQKGEEVAEDAAEANCVGVLVVKDGKVLCGRRNEPQTYRQICGPGGHIEDGETPEEAAIREAQEEFSITPKGLLSLGLGKEEEDGCIPEVFLCTDYDGEVECNSREMEDPRFVELEKLVSLDAQLFKPFKGSLSIMMHTLYAPQKPQPEEKPMVVKFLDKVREKLKGRGLTTGAVSDIIQNDSNRGHAGSYDKLTYDGNRGHAGSYDKLTYDSAYHADEEKEWDPELHPKSEENGRFVKTNGGKGSKKKGRNKHERETWADKHQNEIKEAKAKEEATKKAKEEADKKAGEEKQKKEQEERNWSALKDWVAQRAKRKPGYTIAEPRGKNKFVQGLSPENLEAHWYGGINPLGKPINSHKHEFEGMTMEEYGKLALDLAQSPVGGDILGYVNKENQIVRFNKKTGLFVKGDPNIGIATCFKARFPAQKGEKYKLQEAMVYYMAEMERDIKDGGIG